jgi:hypothetical protein
MYYKDTNNQIKNTFGKVLDSNEIQKNGLFKKTNLINPKEIEVSPALKNPVDSIDPIDPIDTAYKIGLTKIVNPTPIPTIPMGVNIKQVLEKPDPKVTTSKVHLFNTSYVLPVLSSFLIILVVLSSASFAINKVTSQNNQNNKTLLPVTTDQSLLSDKMVDNLITSEQIKTSKESYSKMDTFTGYMFFEKDENLGNYFEKNSFKKELEASIGSMKKELPDFKLPQTTFWSVQSSPEWNNFKDNYKQNLNILYICSYTVDCNVDDKLPALKKDILNTYASIQPTLESYLKTVDLTCIRGVKENKKIKEMPICNGSLKKQLQKLQGFITTDKQYYNQDSYLSLNSKQKTILGIESIVTLVKLNNEVYSVLK